VTPSLTGLVMLSTMSFDTFSIISIVLSTIGAIGSPLTIFAVRGIPPKYVKRRNGAPYVSKRFLVASITALLLRWGTTGIAIIML